MIINRFSFERQINNYKLENIFDDVSIAGVKYQNIVFGMLKPGEIKFVEEKENEYDSKAIAIYRNDIKLGYMFKNTKLREYVRDVLYDEDVIFIAWLYQINEENTDLRYQLAIYKKLTNENHQCVKEYSFPLTKTNKEDRSDELRLCEEFSPVLFENSYEDERIIVYGELSQEIGELSQRNSEILNKWLCIDNCEVYAYLEQVDDISDICRGSIKVFVYKTEDYLEGSETIEEDVFDDEDNDEQEDESEEEINNDTNKNKQPSELVKFLSNVLEKEKNKKEIDDFEKRKKTTFSRLKDEYEHVFDAVDENLNVDYDYAIGDDEYMDLQDLEEELNKLKKRKR